MDPTAIEQPQPARWASGSAALESRTVLVGELLCESVDLRAGERVLDVRCGSGNAALAAARRFCRVVGLDDDPAALERARRRAEAEGLEVAFVEGDTGDLAFPNGSFDVVLCARGTVDGPDAERVAAELLRVCRPGGRIGLVAWTRDSYAAELLAAVGGRSPSAGFDPPPLWGGAGRLRELFGSEVAITAPRRSFLWRFPTAEHQVEFLATFHGPTVDALEALGPDGAEALKARMLEAARRFDVSDDETLVLRMDYLEMVVHRPAWR